MLASGLALAHVALAGALTSPRLVIDEGEAEKLATAIDNVLSHYVSMDVDPITRDWFMLAIVAGGIYGPRILSALNERPAKPTPPAQEQPTELRATSQPTRKINIPGVGDVDMPVN